MVASIQIGTASSYYARDYYHGGERQLAAAWFARANHFGVKDGAAVDIDLFTQLHAGLDTNGASLLTTTGRTVEGVDITFSVPKSVSLAYALTADENLRNEILAAHHRAVRAALTVLDDEAIFARRGRNGLVREKASLTAALFTHDSARPAQHLDGSIFADPQCHTHAVCFNLALRQSDGTVGGIDTRLGPFKLMTGGVYHAHLAHGLSQLGFAIQEIGRNGIFEIGFDRTIRKFFSARRNQVVEELDELGLDTASAPALAAAAALKTRRNKDGDLGDQRFALWRSKAAELGVDVPLCVERLHGQENGHSLGDEADFAKALALLPQRLTEFEATFSRKDLIRAVANAYVGTLADPADLIQTVDQIIKTGAIVEIRRDPLNEPIYSTPEMIWLERETLLHARELADRQWSGINTDELQKKIVAASLSAEQAGVAAALAGPSALVLLSGKAGTGKNHALKPLIAQMREDGYRVILAATAWRTVEMGAAELDGVEGRALDSWHAIARMGGNFIDDRTVIVVDEAGQLGVKMTHAILGEALRCGNGPKVILCGDSAQLKPIAASAGLEILRYSAEEATLKTVVRQRDPAMRHVVEQLSRGEVMPAYDALEKLGCIVDVPGHKQAIATAVDGWFAAQQAEPDKNHLLIARTNATVRALNNEIRKRLRRDGQIQGENVVVTAGTVSDDPFGLALAAGDRVRFGRRCLIDGRRVINGTSAKIEHIERDGDDHARIIAWAGRKRLNFSTAELVDERGNVRLSHDYATTVYSSQGLTSDSCTVVVDPSYDRHSLYVSASRARGQTTLIVNASEIDAIVVADRRYSERPNEVTVEERRATLLARLARSQHKTTTLEASDVTELTTRSVANASLKRRTKRELGHEL
ncbi:MobF family relaxase [Bradyrhizobium sp. HKCCYLS2038]|uniref:MobF family relaxase n=1 Tax=unclassified Bradyrhizobium TaxID=2631580 RepID=UPI003EC14653